MRGQAQSFSDKDINQNNLPPLPEPARHTISIHQKPRCPVCDVHLADWNPGPNCFRHSPRVGAWYTSEASQRLSRPERDQRGRWAKVKEARDA